MQQLVMNEITSVYIIFHVLQCMRVLPEKFHTVQFLRYEKEQIHFSDCLYYK